MTIGRGTTWGVEGALPAGAPTVSSDAELHALVVAHLGSGEPLPVIGLRGGGLWRTVGGAGAPARLGTPHAMHLPVDVIEADLDDRRTWFVSTLVAHDVARRRWVVALNGQFVGTRQLGPRAHPGDGLLDVYQGALAPGELIEVLRRARNGAHLPHPHITGRRSSGVELHLDRRHAVRLDGVSAGHATRLAMRVLPDALTVVV